jgi:hypothetical protein
MAAISLAVLSGCTPTPAAPSIPEVQPTATAGLPAEAAPQAQSAGVQVVEYDLGETTIVQSQFPEDSRFRQMPVRLTGVLAVPEAREAPAPVVLLLHGNHPGCPVPDNDKVDRWPCAPEDEALNYRGLRDLAADLAEAGYLALSININAEYTFGFGEPVAGERLVQLLALHLGALQTASEGGPNPFGVELTGLADPDRLALLGHSRGAELAYWLAQPTALEAADPRLAFPVGWIDGVVMVAPAVGFAWPGTMPVPFLTVLPACDADMAFQEGQVFYEEARSDPANSAWAASLWLEGANHNAFNTLLQDEALARPGRPDCDPLLPPEAQREFLTATTLDFLAALFAPPGEAAQAAARLGMDPRSPAPDRLYGQAARLASLAPGEARLPVLIPLSADELGQPWNGGRTTAEGITTHFCPEGYYTPFVLPGSEPCKRVNLTIPGNPAMVVVTWPQPGGSLRFTWPEGLDLRHFAAASLRVALDPTSELNIPGQPPSITLELTDAHGGQASLPTRPLEPALAFPAGETVEDDLFEGGLFSGRVPLTTLRFDLASAQGVDLQAITEASLMFDQAPSGALFLADFEFVQAWEPQPAP